MTVMPSSFRYLRNKSFYTDYYIFRFRYKEKPLISFAPFERDATQRDQDRLDGRWVSNLM